MLYIVLFSCLVYESNNNNKYIYCGTVNFRCYLCPIFTIWKGVPVQQTIRSACSEIKLPAREREISHVRSRSKDVDEWIRICGKETNRGRQKEAGRIAAFQEWAKSWVNNRVQRSDRRATADPESWNAAKIITDQQTGRKRLNFKGTPSNIHLSLSRAQSSVATQIRNEHIGLNSYLYRRKVPGVHDPSCQCGYPSQNVKHMVLACPQWARRRGEVLRLAKDRSFEAMMNSAEDVARITQWIITQGWIEQFRLVGEVEKATSEKMKRSGKGQDGIYTG
ncbi:hypothetical protein K3495_g9404 [Podosphaera aphanis]|nr:hypothetical protein K3495_g9404 [Podosphaera aphanis]